MKPQQALEVRSRRRGRTLAQAVVDELAEKIRAGAYAPGGKLPTEPELVAAFDVSRTVVREAMSRLQAMRLTETRHGIGTFVLSAPSPGRLDRTTVVTIRDVLEMLEFRTSFEMEAAALAAARRSTAQLVRMERALQAMDHAYGRGRDDVRADLQLHLEVALATGNRYFEELLVGLDTSAIPRTRLDTARLSSEPRAAYLQKVNFEHRAIFEAIARKNADAARAAMRLHLTNSMERLRRASRARDLGCNERGDRRRSPPPP